MPALVALDRDGVRALGVDGEGVWSNPPEVAMPVEVHVAVTSQCAAGCEGCYLDARADGEHVPFAEVAEQLRALAAQGVFTVAFGGGEPTTRDDLGELGALARELGLVPVLTTSGLGLSAKKIARLSSFAQINVSYDGIGDGYADVRGFDGAAHAERAIGAIAGAGLRVGVNVVLTRATFGALEATVARAHALGAREAQLLRYKPAGRAKSLDYLARRLSPEQRAELPAALRRLALRPGAADFRVRIDCALVPFLSTDAELYSRPGDLVAAGVLGCEAGAALAAARVDGLLAPCSFAEPSAARTQDVGRDYAADATMRRYREFAQSAPEPCASCAIRAVCKGGCKIVSQYEGGFGPDPECLRVITASADAAIAPER